MRRYAQRAASIRSEGNDNRTARDCNRRARGRAARNEFEVPWITDSAVHGVVARRFIGEFRHRGIADAPSPGAIEEIERSRMLNDRHYQRLSKPAMRHARSGDEDVFCRVRHAIENTARKGNRSTFKFSKSFEPRIEPSRKLVR